MALPPIVALEIGTSKVIALVGEMREDGHVMITGMGESPSIGVRKGEIIDLENAATCVRSVLERAEESGAVSIRQVMLAVSGGHLQGLINRGTVPVMDKDGEITREDIEQVMEVARAVNLATDRDILHTICRHFCIDNQERVVQPEGMEGASLSVDMLVLHGVRSRLNNAVRVARSIPVDVQDVAFSGLCAALSVLSVEQKKGGVVVIDLGGGTANYLAYAENVVAAAGVLAVGGDHITNDIMLAFNIPTSRAEWLKREWGSAVVTEQDSERRVKLPPEVGFPGRAVSLKSLHTVIHARVDETFRMIRKRLDKEGVLHHIGAGVVLTGGVAHLRNICELGERVFGLPCSVGRPRNISGLATATEGPEYAVCSGLIQYGFKTNGDRRPPALPLAGWIGKMFGRQRKTEAQGS